ncbi:MAG: Flp pilus assembly protein CpaB [Acidobacteria bacterium]|nr:Flp pilus assembly protein CpaB [Acidobacteriota bacterium]
MGVTGALQDQNRRKLLIVIGVGFVAATVCTFLFYRMISGRLDGGAAAAGEERTITVAAGELPRGKRLEAADLKTQPYSGGELPEGVFSDPVAVVGRTVSEGLREGQAIRADILATTSSDWLAASVPKGMRGVTVHVGEFAGVTAHLQVGDRVDVMVAEGDRSPGTLDMRLKTLLQNIEVVDTGREASSGGRNETPVVTLLVDARDSQDLSLADQSGAIRLALRNPLDDGTVDSQGTRLRDLLSARDDADRNTRRQAASADGSRTSSQEVATR